MEYGKKREVLSGYRSAGRQRGVVLGKTEKRRLIQLAVCLALFLTVFLSRGTGRLSALRRELYDAVYGSADVRAVCTDLSWALATDQPLRVTADTLWNGLFAPEDGARTGTARRGTALEARLTQLNTGTFPGMAQPAPEAVPDPMASSGARPKPQEPEVIHMDYTGPALPDNATMDRYALGLEETVTPVLGVLASGFGWREHPIDGGQKFHQGVDLDVPTGTPVLAFADGVVDYIGESEVYGQYLQLSHSGNVTTFYCHCSRLMVQEGQSVTAGQPVAEVGATGRVTGPHLHFEVRKNGVLLQPLYYIETKA